MRSKANSSRVSLSYTQPKGTLHEPAAWQREQMSEINKHRKEFDFTLLYEDVFTKDMPHF